MKLSKQFTNYKTSLDFLISDKNPVLSSNDAKKLSYFIGLANIRKGFDYYELDRFPDGGVRFSLVTMKGFKTIVETKSDIYHSDLSEQEWFDIIYKTSINHFGKEEYSALKNNEEKQLGNSSGCVLTLVIFILFPLSIYLY